MAMDQVARRIFVAAVVGALLNAVALIFFTQVIKRRVRAKQLQREGARASGKITKKYVSNSGCHLQYEFLGQGGFKFNGDWVDASKEAYASAEEGQEVEVCYLTWDPTIHMLALEVAAICDKRCDWNWIFIAGMIISGIGCVALVNVLAHFDAEQAEKPDLMLSIGSTMLYVGITAVLVSTCWFWLRRQIPIWLGFDPQMSSKTPVKVENIVVFVDATIQEDPLQIEEGLKCDDVIVSVDISLAA